MKKTKCYDGQHVKKKIEQKKSRGFKRRQDYRKTQPAWLGSAAAVM